MVSRALATPESAGKRLDVHGPQALTIADALRIYCQQLAPGTRGVTRPLWLMTVLLGHQPRPSSSGASNGTTEDTSREPRDIPPAFLARRLCADLRPHLPTVVKPPLSWRCRWFA